MITQLAFTPDDTFWAHDPAIGDDVASLVGAVLGRRAVLAERSSTVVMLGIVHPQDAAADRLASGHG